MNKNETFPQKDVFINKTSSFLPNQPVTNDEIENYIGKIDGKSSRARSIILRQNKIITRYYALNTDQRITHSNAELAKSAINLLFDNSKPEIDLLACGTSNADLIIPSHASMVHGLLDMNPVEIYSLSGVCLTGIQALKVAYLSILSQLSEKAVCCASELASVGLLSKNFELEYESLSKADKNPYIAFEKDFLRFMLSDGAGAFLLEGSPNSDDFSLKIEWIEQTSYANELPVCMYSGGEIQADGYVKGWKEFQTTDLMERSILMIKQNIKLLKDFAIKYWVDHIETVLLKHNVESNKINYVIPHVSSMFFYDLLDVELKSRHIQLPKSKWFTNLSSVGNIGSASIYIALNELFYSGKLKKDDTILLLVPESGRFSYGSVLLTVV